MKKYTPEQTAPIAVNFSGYRDNMTRVLADAGIRAECSVCYGGAHSLPDGFLVADSRKREIGKPYRFAEDYHCSEGGSRIVAIPVSGVLGATGNRTQRGTSSSSLPLPPIQRWIVSTISFETDLRRSRPAKSTSFIFISTYMSSCRLRGQGRKDSNVRNVFSPRSRKTTAQFSAPHQRQSTTGRRRRG